MKIKRMIVSEIVLPALHRALPCAPASDRRVWRTKLADEEPIA